MSIQKFLMNWFTNELIRCLFNFPHFCAVFCLLTTEFCIQFFCIIQKNAVITTKNPDFSRKMTLSPRCLVLLAPVFSAKTGMGAGKTAGAMTFPSRFILNMRWGKPHPTKLFTIPTGAFFTRQIACIKSWRELISFWDFPPFWFFDWIFYYPRIVQWMIYQDIRTPFNVFI